MHYNDDYIEQLILQQLVTDSEFVRHLSECSFCRERYEYFLNYYDEFNHHLEIAPDESEKVLTDKLSHRNKKLLNAPVTSKLLKQYEQDDRSYKLVRIVFNIQKYVKAKPLVSVTGFIGIAALIIFGVINIVKPATKNVSHISAEKGFLIAYDEKGERYWAKYIGEGFDKEALIKRAVFNENISHYEIVDIDGDGINEVIVTTSAAVDATFQDRRFFYCYNCDGTLRWSFIYHYNLKTDKDIFPDEYLVTCFKVFDLDNDGKKELYAIAHLNHFYPCFIIHIDIKTGKKISEYYHPGYLSGLFEADIDNDGKKELMSFGVSNSFGKGIILALKYNEISGSAPSDEERRAINIKPANEKLYMLFPKIFPDDFSELRFNNIWNVSNIDPSFYNVKVVDRIVNGNYHGVFFKLNKNFKCIAVDIDDELKVYLEKLQKEGKLHFTFNQSYLDSLGTKIIYLKR